MVYLTERYSTERSVVNRETSNDRSCNARTSTLAILFCVYESATVALLCNHVVFDQQTSVPNGVLGALAWAGRCGKSLRTLSRCGSCFFFFFRFAERRRQVPRICSYPRTGDQESREDCRAGRLGCPETSEEFSSRRSSLERRSPKTHDAAGGSAHSVLQLGMMFDRRRARLGN